MTGYLLDTNAWIAFLKGNAGVTAGVQRAGVQTIYMCSPVWFELWFGACKSQRIANNQAHIRDLASQVTSLHFDDRAAELCSEIRALLASQGQPIGPCDLQIAAIAPAAGLCLVTRNVSEFSRVPYLQIENWQDV